MVGMIESLSIEQARKLVLLAQHLPSLKKDSGGPAATRSTIEHLGYIQIDTISVVERAHHHTLWNRNPGYKDEHLDKLLRKHHIFEYWSHAASYLPMRDYRFSLIRKKAIASGSLKHWYTPDPKLMKFVYERIRSEGPLMAKDFESPTISKGGWSSKPTKRALEALFMRGDLMVPYRINFHKVYNLTERVVPSDLDTSVPTPQEYARFLIQRYLQANGIGQPEEITYLQKNNTRELVTRTLKEMVLNKELIQVRMGDENYYTLPASLDLLNKRLARSRLKILSPFDNLIIQRKRTSKLFDFDYTLECYLPETKRRFGFFSLPVLWDATLVARMDCKAERKQGLLHIHHLVLEPRIRKIDAFVDALVKELRSFAVFNTCNTIKVHNTSPAEIKPLLEKEMAA